MSCGTGRGSRQVRVQLLCLQKIFNTLGESPVWGRGPASTRDPAAHTVRSVRTNVAAAWIVVAAGIGLAGCGGKPTCPADDLNCLTDSLLLSDVDDDLNETKVTLVGINTERFAAAQEVDLADGGANQSRALALKTARELSFDTSEDYEVLFLTWTDPLGCRPALCFTHCPKNVRCLGTTRCGPSIRDGLQSGSSFHRVEYAKAPEGRAEFGLAITPVSAEGCPEDVTGLIEADAPGLLMGSSFFVDVVVPGKNDEPAGAGGGAGGGGGSGGGGACSISFSQCCSDGASLCGVSPASCDDCPTGTRKGILCTAGSPCNTSGGIAVGSRICHCQ